MLPAEQNRKQETGRKDKRAHSHTTDAVDTAQEVTRSGPTQKRRKEHSQQNEL